MSYQKLNALYDTARQRMLAGDFVWDTGSVFRMIAVDETFVFDASHEKFSNTHTASFLAVSDPLINLTATSNGYARGSGAKFPSFFNTKQCVAGILVEDVNNGVVDDMLLVAHISDAPNLPFAPDGNDWYFLPDFTVDSGWFRP